MAGWGEGHLSRMRLRRKSLRMEMRLGLGSVLLPQFQRLMTSFDCLIPNAYDPPESLPQRPLGSDSQKSSACSPPFPVVASDLLSFFLSVRERHANLGATNGVPDKTGLGNG